MSLFRWYTSPTADPFGVSWKTARRVVLVPADPALRRAGVSKSAPCDSAGHYEVLAVRPGDYYALALAGNGPVLALNEASSLLDEASKVTVRSGESSSADLRAVTKPVF